MTVAGSTATIQFTSAAVSGSLKPTSPAFNSAGTQFTFTITGVTYTGGHVYGTGSPQDLISEVEVSSASNGVSVVVSLRSARSKYQFGLGHDQVGVSFS